MKSVSAVAHANIALIKYWGKQSIQDNLPATGSLSLTLDCFFTKTTLKASDKTSFSLNGVLQGGERLKRVEQFLAILGPNKTCEVISENHVPTQSGLASSASGFAALATAANAFFGLELDKRGLSELARQGSGSAARSIFAGFSLMHQEGYAEEIDSQLDISLVVVHCSASEKELGSREAMLRTAETSVYYPAWLASHAEDLENALKAIHQTNFEKLGELTEYSTLKMHASMLASKPAIWYFEPISIAVMNAVRDLRRQGLPVYFTLDAGPHVKILCQTENIEILRKALQEIIGISKIEIARPGPGAYVYDQ